MFTCAARKLAQTFIKGSYKSERVVVPAFVTELWISWSRLRGNRKATRGRHQQGLLFPKISMLPKPTGEDPAGAGEALENLPLPALQHGQGAKPR